MLKWEKYTCGIIASLWPAQYSRVICIDKKGDIFELYTEDVFCDRDIVIGQFDSIDEAKAAAELLC